MKSAPTLDAAPNTVEQDATMLPNIMNISLSSDQLEDMIDLNDCHMRALIDDEVTTLLDRRLEALIAHMEKHVKVLIDVQITTVLQKMLLAGMGFVVAPEIRGDDSPLMSNGPWLSKMSDGERIIPVEESKSTPDTVWPSKAPGEEMLELGDDSPSVTNSSWTSKVPLKGMVDDSPAVSTASWTSDAPNDRVVLHTKECSSASTALWAPAAQGGRMVVSREESYFIADASLTSEAPLSRFLAPPMRDTTVSTTVPPTSDPSIGVRLDVHVDGSIGVRLDVLEEEPLVIPDKSWVLQIGVQLNVHEDSTIGVQLDVHEDASFVIPDESWVLQTSIPASMTIETTITEVKLAASTSIPQTNLLQLYATTKSTPHMTLSTMAHTQDKGEISASCTRADPSKNLSNFQMDELTRVDTQFCTYMDKSDQDSEMDVVTLLAQQNDRNIAFDSHPPLALISTTQTNTRSCPIPNNICRDTCDMNTPILAWRDSLRKEEIQLIDAINTQLDSGANISMSWIKDRLKNILANQRYHLKAKIMKELNFGNTRDNNSMHLIHISKKMWETMDSMELQLDSMELDDDFMGYPLYNLRNSCDKLDEIICKDSNHMDLLNISKKMWETMDSMKSQLDSMESDRDFMTCHFQDADQAWERDRNMVDMEEINFGNCNLTPTTESVPVLYYDSPEENKDEEDYKDGKYMGDDRNNDIVDNMDDTKEVYKDANNGSVGTIDDTKEVYEDVSNGIVDIDDTKELYKDVKDDSMETIDDTRELFA